MNQRTLFCYNYFEETLVLINENQTVPCFSLDILSLDLVQVIKL